jgi:acid stress-induced BolA-like protein IbaG/YrbA
MLTIDAVKNMITEILPCTLIEVEGDGRHFFVQIVSEAFNGLSRIERHRLIKEALSEKIGSNELHALSISKAITPTEWQQQNIETGK